MERKDLAEAAGCRTPTSPRSRPARSGRPRRPCSSSPRRSVSGHRRSWRSATGTRACPRSRAADRPAAPAAESPLPSIAAPPAMPPPSESAPSPAPEAMRARLAGPAVAASASPSPAGRAAGSRAFRWFERGTADRSGLSRDTPWRRRRPGASSSTSSATRGGTVGRDDLAALLDLAAPSSPEDLAAPRPGVGSGDRLGRRCTAPGSARRFGPSSSFLGVIAAAVLPRTRRSERDRSPLVRPVVAVVARTTSTDVRRRDRPGRSRGRCTISFVGDTMLGDTPDLPPQPGPLPRRRAAGSLRNGADRVREPRGDAHDLDELEVRGRTRRRTASTSGCRRGTAATSGTTGSTCSTARTTTRTTSGRRACRRPRRRSRTHGIEQTGLPGQIAVVDTGESTVAFVGFAPYTNTCNLLDFDAARALIHRADERRRPRRRVHARRGGGRRQDARHRPRGVRVRRGPREPEAASRTWPSRTAPTSCSPAGRTCSAGWRCSTTG